MIRFRLRPLLAIVAVVSALALIAGDAMARPGGKSSGGFGSRGSRTYTAPAPTATAPSTARPIERSMTQPGAATAARPGAAPAAQGGLFGRPGFLGGLAAGFLGAGLLGMLFGHGLFGGLGGLASILGLLVQLAIAGGIAYLIVRWWQRRSQPAQAYAGPTPLPRQMYDEPQPQQSQQRSFLGGAGLGGLGGSAAQAQSSTQVEITGDDFDAFEKLLGEVQTAYGREDLGKLRTLVTPEMLSYFSEELAGNASSGIVNELSDVKLLQGDLSESWSEGNVEYATVAMRFELVDKMVERATGRVVEGSDKPTEATELWTFMRSRGGNWLLSAIQQA